MWERQGEKNVTSVLLFTQGRVGRERAHTRAHAHTHAHMHTSTRAHTLIHIQKHTGISHFFFLMEG